jgi:hypothetical protein
MSTAVEAQRYLPIMPMISIALIAGGLGGGVFLGMALTLDQARALPNSMSPINAEDGAAIRVDAARSMSRRPVIMPGGHAWRALEPPPTVTCWIISGGFMATPADAMAARVSMSS